MPLSLLWDEYKVANPAGYRNSQYCKLYREFLGRVDCCMRQSYVAGEKLFVDYSGQTVPLTDPETGEIKPAQVFVAAGRQLLHLRRGHHDAVPAGLARFTRPHFPFLRRCPAIVVPDNLRSGVSKPCRYEQQLNPSYAELANHYGA